MSYGEMARLIPVAGKKGQQEAEDRATSALLAVMTIVRPFASSLLELLGVTLPKRGRVEAYTQPEYQTSEGATMRPDGLIQVVLGKNTVFEALIEVKTGVAKLDAGQMNTYIEVARANGIGTVVSISNEIEPTPGVHPTEGVRVRGKSGPSLYHISWAKIVAEAIKEHHHRGVDDPEQAWILGEMIRYLTHANSGVVEFSDMGDGWVSVREGALEGRLAKRSPEVADVCQRWDQLLSVVAMRLSMETGANAIEVTPKAHISNPRLRSKEFINSLCDEGVLVGELKVPDSIGNMEATADLRTGRITLSTRFAAPDDRTARARVVWLVKQLKNAPESLLVDAFPKGAKNPVTASLAELREEPTACVGPEKKPPARFQLRLQSPMGQGRITKRRPGFIDSVIEGTVDFYATVVQDLRPFAPKPPTISAPKPAAEPPASDTADEDEMGNEVSGHMEVGADAILRSGETP